MPLHCRWPVTSSSTHKSTASSGPPIMESLNRSLLSRFNPPPTDRPTSRPGGWEGSRMYFLGTLIDLDGGGDGDEAGGAWSRFENLPDVFYRECPSIDATPSRLESFTRPSKAICVLSRVRVKSTSSREDVGVAASMRCSRECRLGSFHDILRRISASLDPRFSSEDVTHVGTSTSF